MGKTSVVVLDSEQRVITFDLVFLRTTIGNAVRLIARIPDRQGATTYHWDLGNQPATDDVCKDLVAKACILLEDAIAMYTGVQGSLPFV